MKKKSIFSRITINIFKYLYKISTIPCIIILIGIFLLTKRILHLKSFHPRMQFNSTQLILGLIMILHIWNLRNKFKSNKREKTKIKLNLRLKSINPSKTLNISIIWEIDQDLQIKESNLQSTLLSILNSKMTISFQSKLKKAKRKSNLKQ